jgi:allantoinase
MTTDRLIYPHRQRGLDHGWFANEPTLKRSKISWPNGARIALWITVPLEFFPLDAAAQPFRPLGALPLGYPDLWNYSNRDYGLRIGIYRLMRVLDELGLRATAAINSIIADNYPQIIDEVARRQWEFMANGVDMGRVHHNELPIDNERQLIQSARDVLEKASGYQVRGWHSPGRSQSRNTLTLLAEEGFSYVTDWANDDMPYAVTTSAGQLLAMPLAYELSDRYLLAQHNLTVEDYVDQALRALTQLDSEARQNGGGRILSLSITPWILGYPHRISALRRLLARILEAGSIWPATGLEIASICSSALSLEQKIKR